jgi:hypothetical protein
MKYGVNIQAMLLALGICFFCINYEANGQEQTGTLRDRDGNIYTIKIMPDNKTWMTSNLNINIPGSYSYENSVQKSNHWLGDYSRRMRAKGGNKYALVATAHKIATIYYKMVRYKHEFTPLDLFDYQQKYKLAKIAYLERKLEQLKKQAD